jgi:hypothetical protein
MCRRDALRREPSGIRRAPWLESSMRALALVLCLAIVSQGCASSGLRTLDAPRIERPATGLQPVNADGLVLGIYALAGAVIVVAGVIDIVLLPFSAAGVIEFFPCCTALFEEAEPEPEPPPPAPPCEVEACPYAAASPPVAEATHCDRCGARVELCGCRR